MLKMVVNSLITIAIGSVVVAVIVLGLYFVMYSSIGKMIAVFIFTAFVVFMIGAMIFDWWKYGTPPDGGFC